MNKIKKPAPVMIGVPPAIASALADEMELAGLTVKEVTSGGQRPIGFQAAHELITKHRVEYAKLCKKYALAAVYRPPVESILPVVKTRRRRRSQA